MAELDLRPVESAPAAPADAQPLSSSSSPPLAADSTSAASTTQQGHLGPCCSRPAPDAPSRVAVCRVRPSKRVFVPPPQYGLVEEGLVRSGQPSELNFPFLERLGLRSCVWLAPEEPNEPLYVPARSRPPSSRRRCADALPPPPPSSCAASASSESNTSPCTTSAPTTMRRRTTRSRRRRSSRRSSSSSTRATRRASSRAARVGTGRAPCAGCCASCRGGT